MPKKIGYKLILAVAVVAAIVIGIFAYINVQSQSRILLEEVERHIDQLSETIKSSTHYDMLSNRRDDIHNIIQTIGTQPCILEVRVLNKDGEIIYSSDSSSIGHMVDKQAEACYGCHAADQPIQRLPIKERMRLFQLYPDSARVMGIINPIYNEKSCWMSDCHAHSSEQTVLGVLDINVCLKSVDQQILLSKYKMLSFALISIVSLSLVLGFFVKKFVDKPVNELVKATQIVASGDLKHTIQKSSNDEIGLLARSFNNMTQKLSEARLQLFQSDKMASLGRLAAGVAHEINNPLTGILTYSSYLLKRTQNDKDMQNDLSIIVRETMRSRDIVKGLLDFARQSVPKKRNTDINQIIEQALSIAENELLLHKITVIRTLDPKLPSLTVDANQIQQVFLNLIVNADHAMMEKGGELTVSTAMINLLPQGVALIRTACCPKGHDLMDQSNRIDGFSSIKLLAKQKDREGLVYIDPGYGRHNHNYGMELSVSDEFDLACPKCKVSLLDKDSECPKCHSKIYRFDVPPKGPFVGCSNKNCDWQVWVKSSNNSNLMQKQLIFRNTQCLFNNLIYIRISFFRNLVFTSTRT